MKRLICWIRGHKPEPGFTIADDYAMLCVRCDKWMGPHPSVITRTDTPKDNA